jgi:hypothetical protein
MKAVIVQREYIAIIAGKDEVEEHCRAREAVWHIARIPVAKRSLSQSIMLGHSRKILKRGLG